MDKKLDDLERLIVAGHTSKARAELIAFPTPREAHQIVRLGALLRRVGLCSRALVTLGPLLFPERITKEAGRTEGESSLTLGGFLRKARSGEAVLEYALNLARLGGGAQAISLLSELERGHVVATKSAPRATSGDPRILYAMAAAHTTGWDYEKAQALFSAWLETQDPDSYATAIGHLNHAHCSLRLGDSRSASRSLDALLSRTKRNGWTLVHANARELEARLLYQSGDSRAARAPLDEALGILADRGLADRLSALRLDAYILCAVDARSGMERLARLRAEAMGLGHGETVREIELFLATEHGDETAAKRVFYGSPYPWFLARTAGLEDVLGTTCAFRGPDFEPVLGHRAHHAAVSLLAPATGWAPASALKPAFAGTGRMPVLTRLLSLLASDFYRRWPAVALHVALFPERIFHPEHSERLVRAHMSRLRAVLPPSMGVGHDAAGYRLRLDDTPVSFRRPGAAGDTVAGGSRPEAFPSGPFTAKEHARASGLAERTAQRLLARHVESGTLARLGDGPSTRYVKVL